MLLFKITWVFFCSFVMGMTLYIFFNYIGKKNMPHIIAMSLSYMMLLAVDMYRIGIEESPLTPVMGGLLLAGFVTGAWGLWHMAYQRPWKNHREGDRDGCR